MYRSLDLPSSKDQATPSQATPSRGPPELELLSGDLPDVHEFARRWPARVNNLVVRDMYEGLSADRTRKLLLFICSCLSPQKLHLYLSEEGCRRYKDVFVSQAPSLIPLQADAEFSYRRHFAKVEILTKRSSQQDAL